MYVNHILYSLGIFVVAISDKPADV